MCRGGGTSSVLLIRISGTVSFRLFLVFGISRKRWFRFSSTTVDYSDRSMSTMLDRSNCATTSEQSIFNHFCFTLDRTIDDCGLRGTFIWFAPDEKIAFHALLFHT